MAERKPRRPLVERAGAVADVLLREFPDATCALHYSNAFELVVATILSAQCTDERVNMVTPGLFKRYPSPRAFAESPPGELEEAIHSTGFFNNKAKAIREMARGVEERFGGRVPAAMEELLTLRGVARKTANVVRANAFGMPAITVDTHFTRISHRLGLTKEDDPEKIEFDVAALLAPERYSHFSHAVILHGRRTCKARKPACGECPLGGLCPSRESA
ncbi:MAG: endonuclease III [Candidatus Sumerlaeia bacterium]|nr:endonuclease III [Candidatus Sumerlaeia bacterium]